MGSRTRKVSGFVSCLPALTIIRSRVLSRRTNIPFWSSIVEVALERGEVERGCNGVYGVHVEPLAPLSPHPVAFPPTPPPPREARWLRVRRRAVCSSSPSVCRPPSVEDHVSTPSCRPAPCQAARRALSTKPLSDTARVTVNHIE